VNSTAYYVVARGNLLLIGLVREAYTHEVILSVLEKVIYHYIVARVSSKAKAPLWFSYKLPQVSIDADLGKDLTTLDAQVVL